LRRNEVRVDYGKRCGLSQITGLAGCSPVRDLSRLVDANASLNSVRELDAATLDQIRRACREQTEKLEEADTKKNEADDDQYPNIPGPGPRTEINQKYQSNMSGPLKGSTSLFRVETLNSGRITERS
jgi:hypothetical protein